MLKKSKGNMYPWVDYTWSVIRGACAHKCDYCYVTRMAAKFKNMGPLITGPIRLAPDFGTTELPKRRATIFVEHLNDLWADGVENPIINAVLDSCRVVPQHTYVFQTKNPMRWWTWFPLMPARTILGTTIETNREELAYEFSKAPGVDRRADAMLDVPRRVQTFVTVEPILDFDVDVFAAWLIKIRPNFVNIGADSKGSNLPEPPGWKVVALMERLRAAKIEIRQKTNLERILMRNA